MRFAARVATIHFAASLALWLVSYQGDKLGCCGILSVTSYLATLAFYIINLPGIPVARVLVAYSMSHTLRQELASDAVMILSTEAILALIVLAARRAMQRAA